MFEQFPSLTVNSLTRTNFVEDGKLTNASFATPKVAPIRVPHKMTTRTFLKVIGLNNFKVSKEGAIKE